MLEPASFTGTTTRYTVEREGDEAPPQFSDTLRLGRPEDVTSGSPLLVLGWPSPDGQTSIFVDSTHECLAREGTIIRTRAFIHAGSSGGPALNSSLQAAPRRPPRTQAATPRTQAATPRTQAVSPRTQDATPRPFFRWSASSRTTRATATTP